MANEGKQKGMRPPAQGPSGRFRGDELRWEEDTPALDGGSVVLVGDADDLAGCDHEGVAGRHRPLLVVKLDAARAALEVREHEEVMRVGMTLDCVAGRHVRGAKAQHTDRWGVGLADVGVDRAPADVSPSELRRFRW
jgi:hypothetical protein